LSDHLFNASRVTLAAISKKIWHDRMLMQECDHARQLPHAAATAIHPCQNGQVRGRKASRNHFPERAEFRRTQKIRRD
jgi:hypothetical protein